MSKYIVHFNMYASTAVEVEADNVDEAKEIAMSEFDAPCLCHYCSDKIDLSDEGEISAVTKLD